MTFLKNNNFYGIGNLLIKNNSYTELINQLCVEIQKLKNPILITFEDIDRIQDKDLIHKIFALSEQLTAESNRVRILFQYDESKLLDILEEEKIYLEKYIPHTLELTPINFSRCIKVLLKEGKSKNKYSSLQLDDFGFLTYPTSLDFHLKQYFGVDKSFSLDIHFSIRKVALFLDEIDELMNENTEFKSNKQTLIVFLFIKHFGYSNFADFSEDEPYSLCKLFTYKGNNYSIYELINLFEEYTGDKNDLFDTIFANNSKNLNHLIYMHYFGYDFTSVKKVDSENPDERMANVLNEEIDNIKIKEHNDKINRLIKNLLCNGKSEYTNLENAVKEMEKVLDKSTQDEKDNAFTDFCKSAFYEEFEKGDNKTIFKLGMSSFISLFQGFSVYEKDDGYWIKLIDFYFEHEKITSISAEVIQVLNYCDISKRNIFIHIIEKFTKLKIKGNLNSSTCYPRFLKLYVGAFASLGYIDTRLIDVYSFNFVKLQQNKKNYFDLYCTFSDKLRALKQSVPLEQVKKECNLLKDFLKQNIRLIISNSTLKEYTGGIKTSYEIKDSLEDVFKELDVKIYQRSS